MAGTREPVAVLGTGAMGRGMAASALRAGIPTLVWDRRAEAAGDLAGLGGQVAATAADELRADRVPPRCAWPPPEFTRTWVLTSLI